MCFKRNTYVGYTATPLANAFINYSSNKKDEGRDIFPKDFIKVLKDMRIILDPKMFWYCRKKL